MVLVGQYAPCGSGAPDVQRYFKSDHIGDGQHGQGDFDETKNNDNEDDPEKGFLSQVFHDGE